MLFQELCDITVADALVASLFHEQGSKQPHLSLIISNLEDIARGIAYIHSKNVIHGRSVPFCPAIRH